jgi:hypothetical protein
MCSDIKFPVVCDVALVPWQGIFRHRVFVFRVILEPLYPEAEGTVSSKLQQLLAHRHIPHRRKLEQLVTGLSETTGVLNINIWSGWV